MKSTLAKVISALMIATALLGFAAVLPAIAVWPPQPDAVVFIDPPFGNFTGLNAGDTFAVNVSIANCTGIVGVSFTLHFNTSCLNVLSDSEVLYHDPLITPPAKMTNIQLYSDAFDNGLGTFSYGYAYLNIAGALADGYAPINITTTGSSWSNASYSWPNGKHGLATVVFTVMPGFVPPSGAGNFVQTALTLTDVVIGDKDGDQITTGVNDGMVQNNWAAPPLPFWTVQFPNYTATYLGQLFNVSVLINALSSGWQAVGFEFKMSYNASLLSIVNVYEGPFLPPFGAPPNQGTLFATFQGANYIQVGDVVLPDVNGTWHAPFPSGTGIIATIEFNATMIGTFPEILQCPLPLYDTLIGDVQANTIGESQPPVGSWYSISPPFPVAGRIIDLFTQWPFPYGGQGPNNPSDMFWPQKDVVLEANVSYNGWPEQMKDVAFAIIAPSTSPIGNTTWAIIYARTNAYGIAQIAFRLPWPCDNPEAWFGVWTVVASVDIACTIVNDTLQFHFDYLVRIFKETVDIAPPNGYNHEQTAGGLPGTPPYIININVTFGTYLWQDSLYYVDNDTGTVFTLENFTLAATAMDNLSVPFGYTYLSVPIPALSNYAPWHFCEYRNITVTVSIPVPKFAAAGPGMVYEAILSDWPYNGGTVISGYYDPISGTWMPSAPTPIIINAV